MTPETGREAECWIKLSLLTVLSVPEILRLLQQTGGVEALFDASSGTLTKLAGETAAREIREVNSSGEAERILSWLSETKGVGFIRSPLSPPHDRGGRRARASLVPR